MSNPEFRKQITEWISKIKFDKKYEVPAKAVDMVSEVVLESNRDQRDFVLTLANNTLIKRDNTRNENNYFVDVIVPEWNDGKKDWLEKKRDIPQRHQLARRMFRKNPMDGHKLMKQVNYPIPGVEEIQNEINTILNYGKDLEGIHEEAQQSLGDSKTG